MFINIGHFFKKNLIWSLHFYEFLREIKLIIKFYRILLLITHTNTQFNRYKKYKSLHKKTIFQTKKKVNFSKHIKWHDKMYIKEDYHKTAMEYM